MIVQKILLLAQLARGPLLDSAGSRAILVSNICRWLKPYLGHFDELSAFGPRDTQATKDGARIAWLEIIRLSVSTVAALLDKLHTYLVQPEIRQDKHALAQEQDSIEFLLSLLPRLLESYTELSKDVSMEVLLRNRGTASVVAKVPVTFPSTYPTPLLVKPPPSFSSGSQPTASKRPFLRHVLGETAAAIVVLVHISSPSALYNYFDSAYEIEGSGNFSCFLSRLFEVTTSLLDHEAFPSAWLNISMLTHKVVVRIAAPASLILRRDYVPRQADAANFDTHLWKGFFGMLLKLLSSPLLVIEDFSPARQRAVWRLAGDLRGEGAKIFLQSWEALSWPEPEQNAATRYGGYQVGLTNLVSIGKERLSAIANCAYFRSNLSLSYVYLTTTSCAVRLSMCCIL